ncbi:MAG: dihydroorotate dehydrogenase electron transfer subunit [Ignavibacteria bacterium]|nr:dihydroorotate dehydrogenase electron transfer subunit [Ignavibacteria bacterium]
MFVTDAVVEKTIELEHNIILLQIFSPEIARIIKPGQFLNVKVSDSVFPLLRRPFSVCDVAGDSIFIMFNIYGEGTKLLSHKNVGDFINILGPLGNGFLIEDEYETAIIVAGGLGAAPFPFLEKKIKPGKKIISFIGGRNYRDVITYGMSSVLVATDDGSLGFEGNVVQLFQNHIGHFDKEKIKVFACGPNAMLRALQKLTLFENINCEVSTECAMACGFGICQGCPIESTSEDHKYLLVCKDGPVFNAKDVVI